MSVNEKRILNLLDLAQPTKDEENLFTYIFTMDRYNYMNVKKVLKLLIVNFAYFLLVLLIIINTKAMLKLLSRSTNL